MNQMSDDKFSLTGDEHAPTSNSETVVQHPASKQPEHEPEKANNKQPEAKPKKLDKVKSKKPIKTLKFLAISIALTTGVGIAAVNSGYLPNPLQMMANLLPTPSEPVSEQTPEITTQELQLQIGDANTTAQNTLNSVNEFKETMNTEFEQLKQSQQLAINIAIDGLRVELTRHIDDKVSALSASFAEQKETLYIDQSKLTTRLVKMQASELKSELNEFISTKLDTIKQNSKVNDSQQNSKTEPQPQTQNTTTTNTKPIVNVRTTSKFNGFALEDTFAWSSERVAVVTEGIGVPLQLLEGNSFGYDYVVKSIRTNHIDFMNIHTGETVRLEKQ